MTIKSWAIDDNSPEWEALSAEQKELLDFNSKLEWEGGILELWHYGGSTYFPEALRQEAETFGNAADVLDKAIHEYAKELDIQL